MEETQIDNPIIDLRSYFCETYDTDFELYTKPVESALEYLIKTEILTCKYSEVGVIGRKGISLFHPYMQKVNGKNHLQGISTIQLFSFTTHPMMKSLYPIKSSNFKLIRSYEQICKRFLAKYILLTDAINSGNEIREVIENLTPEKITKICGYLANKNGLSKLQKDYPTIQFSFIKIVDETNYFLEQDKLQFIYQSRLVPIDGDHPYRIYSLKYQIDIDDLVVHLNDVVGNFLLSDTEIKKDALIVPYLSSYTANLDFNAVLQEIPDLKNNLYDVERVQIRFKFDPIISNLRIMALALIHTSDPMTNGGFSIKYKRCGINISKKMCDTTLIPHPNKDSPQEKICPMCIDKNISTSLLLYTEDKLSKILESKGIRMEKLEVS